MMIIELFCLYCTRMSLVHFTPYVHYVPVGKELFGFYESVSFEFFAFLGIKDDG